MLAALPALGRALGLVSDQQAVHPKEITRSNDCPRIMNYVSLPSWLAKEDGHAMLVIAAGADENLCDMNP